MADQTTHKCAFCYQFIEFNNIQFHDCVQGYSRVFIVETENTFYPQRIDGSLVRPPVIVQQPNQVVFQESQNLSAPSNVVHTTNRQAKQSTSKKKPLSENEIEILIDEVHKRPQLWNYNLHYEDRNHYDVDDLWQEVANSEGLAGRIDAKGAKNKFKNLKDTFRRIVRNEQGTSGSARKNSGKKWRFYEIMQFCRYSLLIDDTESNIMDEPIEPIELDAEPFGQEDAPEHNRADVPAAAVTPLQASAPRSRQIEPTPSKSFKKQRTNSKQSETACLSQALMHLAETTRSDSIQAPQPLPSLDESDLATGLIAHYLRKVSNNQRLMIIIEILNLIQQRINDFEQ